MEGVKRERSQGQTHKYMHCIRRDRIGRVPFIILNRQLTEVNDEGGVEKEKIIDDC